MSSQWMHFFAFHSPGGAVHSGLPNPTGRTATVCLVLNSVVTPQPVSQPARLFSFDSLTVDEKLSELLDVSSADVRRQLTLC